MDFSQITAEFCRLKAQYEAGGLSETDFRARLQDLMVQDSQGRWWMIGYETGQWYVHNGQAWVRGEPNGAPHQPADTMRLTMKPWTVLLVGAAVSLLIGFVIGRWTYAALFSDTLTTGEIAGSVAGFAALLGGLLVTLVLADLARREKGLPLSLVARTLAIWIFCMALACGLGWLFYRAFVNPRDFSGEALALIAGCVVGIGGSLYLAVTLRRDRLGRQTERRP
jgi:hypothetical protein